MRLLNLTVKFRSYAKRVFYLSLFLTIVIGISDLLVPVKLYVRVLNKGEAIVTKQTDVTSIKLVPEAGTPVDEKDKYRSPKTATTTEAKKQKPQKGTVAKAKKKLTKNSLIKRNPPNILIWKSAQFLMQRAKSNLEFVVPAECGGCTVTTNRSTLRESLAVVLFNHHDLENKMDVPDPKTRTPEQHYVFWSKETPAKLFRFKSAIEDPRFDTLFNITWTFFHKSDIVSYFNTIRRVTEDSIKHNITGNLKSFIKAKTKLAVWVVSNCNKLFGTLWRMQYARKLQEAGLKLDKFGDCFDKKNASKLSAIVQDYKFYLSFENSLHCPNYITEKFWRNGLMSGLVPIVWGPTKKDVEKVAPKNSYIHTEDYETPEKLVKYINYLDKHDDKYMEYHKWRDVPLDHIPIDNYAKGYKEEACRLCRYIALEKHPPKSIRSISKWYYGGYVDDKCLLPFTNLTEAEKEELVNF